MKLTKLRHKYQIGQIVWFKKCIQSLEYCNGKVTTIHAKITSDMTKFVYVINNKEEISEERLFASEYLVKRYLYKHAKEQIVFNSTEQYNRRKY